MSYPGGKGGDGVYQRLISLIPPHKVYIEGCLGGGAILKHKRLAPVSVAFDLDVAALARFDYGGLEAQGARVSIFARTWGNPLTLSLLWQYSSDPVVRLIEGDVLAALQHNRKPLGHHCFIYLDPPYLRTTRKSSAPLYRYEWTEQQHRQMLQLAKTLPARVMISGYWSEMYAEALADWRVVSFSAQTRQGPATEYVWMNYPEPRELHDYRYLGKETGRTGSASGARLHAGWRSSKTYPPRNATRFWMPSTATCPVVAWPKLPRPPARLEQI
jgi:hypothetical protein